MRAADALDAWERAGRVPPARRGAELLSAAAGWVDPDAIPVGRRDALLLDLFRTAFGDRIDALSACPSCGVVVEVVASCAVLLSGAAPEPVTPVDIDGYHVEWRPVTGADLSSIVDDDDVGDAATRLLERCVVDAAGRPVSTVDAGTSVSTMDGSAAGS